MGYGRTDKTDSAGVQNFFTAGAGTDSVNTNNFEAENNLDLTNTDISWQRNPQEIGNKIINFPGNNPENPKSHHNQENFAVIEPTMPPGANNGINKSQPDKDKIIEASFDRTSIKTTGDGLDSAGIEELEKVADKKLYKDDDAAGYVDAIRGEDGMAFVNLENSYGANSAWKKAAWQTISVPVKITTINHAKGA